MDGSAQKIGNIRLVEPLGEGGMGTVWAGFDDKLRREVAVKTIRGDRVDLRTRARLLAEARILSQLDHPNICRLYDYLEGEDTDYLVLERIRGRTLAKAIGAGLGEAEKLRIADYIARTLVVSHARGIVHRDLKPGNVMLTKNGGEVKVLDFGLARSVDAPPTGSDEGEPAAGAPVPGTAAPTALAATAAPAGGTMTRFGSLELRSEAGRITGTPANMSPEQARGEYATAASDMYSFGLLLQELFTGRSAYPPGLSAEHLVVKAAGGDTLPADGIDGEVRALIEQLLALAPEARPTASDAAARLRFIRARPQRRRRRLAVAAVAAIALAGSAKYTLDLRAERQQALAARDVAEQARREAEAARSEAEQVTEFMVELFGSSDPTAARGREISVREILDRGAERIERELEDQPLVRARVMSTIAEVYRNLGEYGVAAGLEEQVLDLYRQNLGEESAEFATTLSNLAAYKFPLGEVEEATRLLERALEINERVLGPDHPEVATTLNNLAVVGYDNEHEAEALYRRALDIRERALDHDDPLIATVVRNLASLLERRGEYDEADVLYRRSLDINKRTLPPDHPDLAKLQQNYGTLLYRQGQLTAAETLYRQALDTRRRVLGDGHRDTAITAYSLAAVLERRGELEQAEPLFLDALTAMEAAIGPGHPFVARFQDRIANFYRQRGDFARAEPLLRRALESKRAALGPEHAEVAVTLTNLGWLELARGEHARAVATFTEAIAVSRLAGEETVVDRGRSAAALLGLGRAHAAGGEQELAVESWRRALATLEPAAEELQEVGHIETYAKVLLHLGLDERARPIVAELAAREGHDPDLGAMCRERGLAYG